ncbi:hypothetical protein JTE90_001874 [Oedothorax gibbosus]|uniref:Uncharacterized protein n=1 Tax=Oedothorax gibbosus TaxID=931172 RepID=A0AAV6VQ70_9ARAC|nr:hypothetical protein JTE90_001874 [Oedothorax gibbosus]
MSSSTNKPSQISAMAIIEHLVCKAFRFSLDPLKRTFEFRKAKVAHSTLSNFAAKSQRIRARDKIATARQWKRFELADDTEANYEELFSMSSVFKARKFIPKLEDGNLARFNRRVL